MDSNFSWVFILRTWLKRVVRVVLCLSVGFLLLVGIVVSVSLSKQETIEMGRFLWRNGSDNKSTVVVDGVELVSNKTVYLWCKNDFLGGFCIGPGESRSHFLYNLRTKNVRWWPDKDEYYRYVLKFDATILDTDSIGFGDLKGQWSEPQRRKQWKEFWRVWSGKQLRGTKVAFREFKISQCTYDEVTRIMADVSGKFVLFGYVREDSKFSLYIDKKRRDLICLYSTED